MISMFLLKKINEEKISGDEFYVIEKFRDPHFVTDENGVVKIFATYEEASVEASDCRQGYVISFSG
ncbi:MAG TPA: hypothetical protein VK787_10860 [Puia sp.]|jgi:hypothetical protein|nr:hypothetical protein [Puia sp.]